MAGGWFAKFEELLEPQELPGEPGTVRAAGNKYSHMAQQVLNAADSIRRMANDNGNHVSQAVDKLVDVAGDVGDKVEKLHTRYDAAGTALTAYAGHLERAQHEAKAAMKDFYDAKGARDAANAKASAADDEAKAAGDDDATKQDAQDKSKRLQNAADGHQQAMNDARERYLNAVRNLNTAAQTAHDQIAHAINDDGLKDSRWDKLKNAVGHVVHAVGDFIKKHAAFFKALHKILSIITTALSIASMFFPVLAPFALGFAAATALVGLGLALTGEMSWLDFGIDCFTVLTLGVGAVAGSVMKGAAAGAREVAQVGQVGTQEGARFAGIANDLRMTGGDALKSAAKGVFSKSVGKDLLEFGVAKIPKFAGKVPGLGKVAGNFGKTALSEENAFAGVYKIMGAKGIENFKNLAVLNADGALPKAVTVMNNVAKIEGYAAKAYKQYDHHADLVNNVGKDLGNYGKDLGKFIASHPNMFVMQAAF